MILPSHNGGTSITLSDKDAQTLNRLGLTTAKAKIYLTLLSFEKATAKTIAKEACMDRAETYRMIRALETDGFVERIVANPCQFRPIALSTVVNHLLEKRKNELSAVEVEANLLVNRKRTAASVLTDEVMILVPRPEMVLNQLETIHRNYKTETTVEVISTLSSIEEIVELETNGRWGSLERGAKYTFITEKPSKKNPLSPILKSLFGYRNVTHLYTDGIPKNRMTIEDGKKVWISLERKNFLVAKQLVSTNPCLVSLVKDYFNYVKASSTSCSQR